MKRQDVLEAQRHILKIEGLEKTIELVEKGTFNLIIGNVYQDQRMLAAIKGSILKELRQIITEEDTALLKLGFTLERQSTDSEN